MTPDTARKSAVFTPEVFEVATLEQAMGITVTGEAGTSTQERWEKETRFLIDDISKFISPRPDDCVIDYGCGVGRLSKELIDRFGCRVVGIDASRAMRQFAPEYVLSERFVVWSPDLLEKMIAKGFRGDYAISLWVIQHVFDAAGVISLIDRALRPGAQFYALNQIVRCVPTDQGWVNDGFDVPGALRATFEEQSSHGFPSGVTTDQIAQGTAIQILKKRAD